MQSVLSLTKEERRALVSLTRSRVSPAADVKRARLMIMLDDGLSWKSISKQLPCSPDYINRWRRCFDEDRLGGLYARHRGRAPAKNEAKLEARILAWTQNRPDDGSTHWSSRKLGKALGISHMMVARVWVKHGLRPHRLERQKKPVVIKSPPRYRPQSRADADGSNRADGWERAALAFGRD